MRTTRLLLAAGFAALLLGHAWGLLLAPPEAAMGETGRILVAHIPTAWAGFASAATALVAASVALWTGGGRAHATTRAAVEASAVLLALTVAQGSAWARPTWGVWVPAGDPRFVLTVAGAGLYAALAAWARWRPAARTALAFGAVLVFPVVPLIHLVTRLARTIHPAPSGPGDLDAAFLAPLVPSLLGTTLLVAATVAERARRLARAPGSP